MKIFIVNYTDGYDYNGILKAFTTEEEATRYTKILKEEREPEDMYIGFYVSEIELYNNCEEINE